jgi:predicted TIM-barrel fold metal-dependent hydrolase
VATFAIAISSTAAPKGAAKSRPIIDTHIHIYQVTRPGGVPWPPPANKTLYKDFGVADYKAMAAQHGITGAVIVEASPIYEDNTKILDQIKGDKFYRGLAGNLEVGKPDFVASLDKLAKDPKLVGIRAFLWAPTLTLDEVQIAHVKELAKRGMTLDIISRGTLNPKDKVEKLAEAVPNLRIIIDHLAGAKGKTPTPEWEAAVKRLAAHKNIYIKFSSFFDMFNPAATEDNPWKAPTDLASYKPHFDVLYKAFGPDRLIYGTNYPVVTLGGTVAQHNAIAEEYLAPYGEAVRDKVMYRNAEKFYARQKK